MEIADFLEVVYEEVDGLQSGSITPTTEFRSLEEWSSMIALILIASIESKWAITLSADDLSKSRTFQDLFDALKRNQ